MNLSNNKPAIKPKTTSINPSEIKVGIDQISFHTSNFYLDLQVLADRNDIDVGKFHYGIGQEKMSVPAHDEDIVTLAANAAEAIVNNPLTNKDSIRTVFFATETGIDQSKAAGVYVHRLLGLNSNCRVVELKQACYSATAALQMASALVACKPKQSVLVIASDVARYDLDTPAEATQGCGAVAMLITANPRIMQIHQHVGNYTEEIMDFWRPNYRSTALVDGKFSTEMYLKALLASWKNYQTTSEVDDILSEEDTHFDFDEISHFCYHLPFSRMGQKAHRHLCQHINNEVAAESYDTQIASSLLYNRVIGNSYSAALYISLASLFDNELEEQPNNEQASQQADLTGKHIGLFSYGSGCVSEFFVGTVQAGYKAMLYTEKHQHMLEERTALSYDDYIELWNYPNPMAGESVIMRAGTTGKFKLAGIYEHKRDYIRV